MKAETTRQVMEASSITSQITVDLPILACRCLRVKGSISVSKIN